MSNIFPFQRPTDQYRMVMGIEYKGTLFHGWQVQRSGVSSVQAELEEALSFVANEAISTFVAGRTDAGVHATNQIIHFDTASYRDNYSWAMGVNGKLPNDICVKWAQQADESFHARFSAKERVYRFVIHNSWMKSALFHEISTWERYPLDTNTMQLAANFLVGTHDFSSFRASECQAHSPVRTIRELQVERFGDFVVIQTRADGYLHHMVRNIVGVLLAIGRGRKPVGWVRDVLDFKDRKKGGVTANGNGLYFVRAQYDVAELPDKAAGPDFIQPIIDLIPNAFDKV